MGAASVRRDGRGDPEPVRYFKHDRLKPALRALPAEEVAQDRAAFGGEHAAGVFDAVVEPWVFKELVERFDRAGLRVGGGGQCHVSCRPQGRRQRPGRQ